MHSVHFIPLSDKAQIQGYVHDISSLYLPVCRSNDWIRERVWINISYRIFVYFSEVVISHVPNMLDMGP